ncbi:MAG: Glucose-responsive transcription factor [Caeruleum heppii]|nr:MAG: Glucose-responsive transcription factor [Caeruleum heppii]
MQATQSYPSPNAAGVGGGVGPFYGQPQRLPSPAELQLTAEASRRPHPAMTANSDSMPLNGPSQEMTSGSPGGHHGQPRMEQNIEEGDSTTPRKRTKVSRACDECRRKKARLNLPATNDETDQLKIRCDATSESGLEQCSSCKRVGTRCQFSRIPMKRGPSKGYIKELADRLNTLENTVLPAHSTETQYHTVDQGGQSPRAAGGLSPRSSNVLGLLRDSRKRTLSMSDDSHSNAYVQSQQKPHDANWATPDGSRRLPHPMATAGPQIQQMASAMSESTGGQQHRTRQSANGVQDYPSWRDEQSDAGRRTSMAESSDNVVEWDERPIDLFYSHMFPTFPLLATSKNRLRSRLAQCPLRLREAFLGALTAAVTPLSYQTATQPANMKAAEMVTALQYDEGAVSFTRSQNLVYLQAMIMMAIEADNNRGPAMTRNSHVWLGSAVGLAYHLGLQRSSPFTGDADSDESLGRRIWFILTIMDRWHAASTASPLLVPDVNMELKIEDREVLGDTTFQLTRLSSILGHASTLFTSPPSATSSLLSSSSAGSLIHRLLLGELARYNESSASTSPNPSSPASTYLLEIAFQHIRLLIHHQSPVPEPQDILTLAQELLVTLASPAIDNNPAATAPVYILPITLHANALLAQTFIELADVEETRDRAVDGLRVHQACLAKDMSVSGSRVAWYEAIHRGLEKKLLALSATSDAGGVSAARGVDAASPELQHGGLQRLADLAVRTEAAGGGTTEDAPRNANAASPSSPPPAQQLAGVSTEEESGTFDPTAIIRRGYLSLFADEVV